MKKNLIAIIVLMLLTVPLLAADGLNLDTGGIISIVFGLLATVFGGAVAWFKRKSNKLANFSKQSIEAAMAANDLVQYHKVAIADDKLTKDELKGYTEKAKVVGKETGEAVQAFKELFKKDPGA